MTISSWRCLALGIGVLLLTASQSPAATAHSTGERVNVRSRAGFVGEVITQLSKGQEITVLDTNTLADPAVDEPPVWFKIELPPDAPLWVSKEYINAESKTVNADMLNVRAGPGLDYAVVARLPRETAVKTDGTEKDGWLQVQVPTRAIGYIPTNWVSFGRADRSDTMAASGVPGDTGSSGNRASASSSSLAQGGSTPTTIVPTFTPASSPTAPASTSSSFPEPSGAASPTPPIRSPSGIPGSTSGDSWADQFLRSRSPSPASAQAVTPSASGSVAAQQVSAPPTSPAAPVHYEGPRRDSWAPPPVPAEPTQGVLVEEVEEEVAPLAVDSSASAELTDSTEPSELLPPIPEMPENSDARWVRREGLVIRPLNFAAPSYYALQARDSGKTINFLFSSRENPIPWKEYRGKVVILTGREYLDQRSYWRGVPLLDVEEIEAVR